MVYCGVYFLFLYILIICPFSLTSSALVNPCSIRSWHSLTVIAVLVMHSSAFSISSAILTKWMYLRVVFQSLCPMSSAVNPVSLFFQ